MTGGAGPRWSSQALAHDWFDRGLPEGVLIGPGSWVYSAYAFLHCASERVPPVSIGRSTGVYSGTFFEIGREGQVRIGDFCTIVGAIINVNTDLAIGDYAFIAHDVVIADSAWASPTGHSPRGREAAGGTVIGENVWVGARAVILGGITIGEGAVIGAGAVVDAAVPPFGVAAGAPARIVGDVRHRGLQPQARGSATAQEGGA